MLFRYGKFVLSMAISNLKVSLFFGHMYLSQMNSRVPCFPGRPRPFLLTIS